VGSGRVQLTWHLVAGGNVGPPSTDWGVQAQTIRPRGIGEALHVQYTFTAISKLNFKHNNIFEIILMDKDNFLRLMFAYTTSDVYLTLMFKFEIYSTNFREITYLWPYINSVVMTIFVNLVLIHCLIQIVLMMTNY
jgi:hypothetical protein